MNKKNIILIIIIVVGSTILGASVFKSIQKITFDDCLACNNSLEYCYDKAFNSQDENLADLNKDGKVDMVDWSMFDHEFSKNVSQN